MHIYKITNLVNKKIYIGLSTYDGPQRWDKHRYNANRNSAHHIDRAINKYGEKNFRYEVIEKIPFNKGIRYLENREIFYISKFKSTNSKIGYNRSLGGNVNVAKRVTKSHQLKSSISQKVKKIFSYDLNGKFIKEYRNILIAANENNRSKAAISRVINKSNRSAANKQWRTFNKDVPLKKINKFKKKSSTNSISIYQWSKTGKLIAKHSSMSAAARKVNVPLSSIHRVLEGVNMYAANYHFTKIKKFKKPKDKRVIDGPNEFRKIKINVYSFDGKFIETVKGLSETSRRYGVSISVLSKALRRNIVAQKKGIDDKFYQFTKYSKNKKAIKPIVNFRSLLTVKPILSYSLSGKFLKKFENVTHAANFYKYERSGVRRSADNINYKCGNYLFKWFEGKILKKIKPYESKGVPVLQYNFNGEFVREYKSILDASKKIKINPASIRLCVIGRGYSSGGFYWFKKTKQKIKKKIQTPIPI